MEVTFHARTGGKLCSTPNRESFPGVTCNRGHRGGYLVSHTVDGGVELVVLTFWDSMHAIERFAGANPEKAVVDPEARTMLTECDEFVTHFEVLHSSNNE